MVWKRKFLTLADRVKVSKMADADRTSRWIAKDVGVGKSQIQTILRRKREIIDEFRKNGNTSEKKPRRTPTYDDVNGLVLNGSMVPLVDLSTKALSFVADLGLTEFKTSNGWLESCLRRNNIIFKKMSDERGAVNSQVVKD